MHKLPSLSALRAFESVSRLKSVKKAAEELHVTHPAISHQLKQLESYFNQPLMQKIGRGVGTTKSGELLSQALRL
ncbi:LysR family transcriptional regulator [Dasania marina]|uniref:LysR family transcriptional regulator n=1 Tax=Dasania marina TaxID=471499 RepID=UPI0030DDB2A2|tara:strand:+ start:35291 stop:35515 length:225 start_codon:yes stop_codon:yes gene_type:complete